MLAGMKYSLLILGLCSVVLAVGCSSTPVRVDAGSLHARTFSFVNPAGRAAPDFADNRAAMHALVQDSMARQLEARGLRQMSSGGEVTVAYLVIVGNNASTMAINDYFGYGRDASGLLEKAHDAMAIKNADPNYFEAGVLLVDFIEPGSFKLLKRGYTAGVIRPDATAEQQQQRMDAAVGAVLDQLKIFPPR